MSLKRYEITREIGRGRHGVVYLAHDREHDESVALKRVDVGRQADLKRLVAESRAAAALIHPNIERVRDVFVEDDTLFVVTDLLDGVSLGTFAGRLSWPRAGNILLQLLSALEYAHERGIQHFGLTSENVLVAPNGTSTITDFGLSRVPVRGSAHDPSGDWRRDAYGGHRGRRDSDSSVDLYAVGVIAHELMSRPPPSGRVPTAGDLSLDDHVDRGATDWAGRMVGESSERYADAASARLALEQALAFVRPDSASRASTPEVPPFARAARAPQTPQPDHDLGPLLRRSARAGVFVRHGTSANVEAATGTADPVDPRAATPPRERHSARSPGTPAGGSPMTSRSSPMAEPVRTTSGRLRPRRRLDRAARMAGAIAGLAGAVAGAGKLFGWFAIDIEVDALANREVVDCTVFAPAEAAPGQSLLIQVFVHLPLQEGDARALALEFDTHAVRRVVRGIETEITRGTKLEFVLDLPDAEVVRVVESLVWRGRPEPVQFEATLRADAVPGTRVATVTVMQHRVPIGHVKFKLTVRESTGPTVAGLIAVGDAASRYRRAFLSYATEDRTHAVRGAQMLRLAGIEYFQDLLTLVPGDRWEPRLYEEIERSDLFILFWSQAAKESDWVYKEALHALACQTSEFGSPEIKPFVLERPSSPPWPEFKHLHFNDNHAYFVDADNPP